jgi:hypothetical protein
VSECHGARLRESAPQREFQASHLPLPAGEISIGQEKYEGVNCNQYDAIFVKLFASSGLPIMPIPHTENGDTARRAGAVDIYVLDVCKRVL